MLKSKKIGASGGAAQAAEARSCFSMPASWVGPNSEHAPRPKITKVLTRLKLKITKVAEAWCQTQKL